MVVLVLVVLGLWWVVVGCAGLWCWNRGSVLASLHFCQALLLCQRIQKIIPEEHAQSQRHGTSHFKHATGPRIQSQSQPGEEVTFELY